MIMSISKRKSAIVLDLEIEKAILGKNELPQEGVEYCSGWGDCLGMGIACVCVYDYLLDEWLVFHKANMPELARLVDDRDLVVGFNNISFDNRVLRAHGVDIDKYKCYDIFHKARKAVGGWTSRGMGLNNFALANGCGSKNGNGHLAPILWQRGEREKVVRYCRNDVQMTKALFDKVCRDGELQDPRGEHFRMIQMERPW